MVGSRRGSPLLLGAGKNGTGKGENFLASDTSALLQVTKFVTYLEDGDVVEIKPEGYRIVDGEGKKVTRPIVESQLSADAVELGNYDHYMQKEIFEQPGAIANTLEMVMGASSLNSGLFGAEAEEVFARTQQILICNVPESALIRQSKLRFLTRAGPEIGVASTKAFTTQLAALFLLTLVLAKQRKRLSETREKEILESLRHLPAAINNVLECEPFLRHWAKRFATKHHTLFLGRGVHFPIAMEGALKLKEVTYIHAEAYAAGELKHGPLALVDREMPVVVIAPNDVLIEKLKSNLQEVRARGGELFVFADRDTVIEPGDGINIINLGDHAGLLSPILHVIPLQLLAYHAALARGTDVDKPRNLAKSVTVE